MELIGVLFLFILEIILLLIFYLTIRKEIKRFEDKYAPKPPRAKEVVVIGDLLDKATESGLDYITITKDKKTLIQSPFDLETLLVLAINYRDYEVKDYEWEYDSDNGVKWLHINI